MGRRKGKNVANYYGMGISQNNISKFFYSVLYKIFAAWGGTSEEKHD